MSRESKCTYITSHGQKGKIALAAIVMAQSSPVAWLAEKIVAIIYSLNLLYIYIHFLAPGVVELLTKRAT